MFLLSALLLNAQENNAPVPDSLALQASDTLNSAQKKKKKPIVDAPVNYTSKDSMTVFIDSKEVFLFGSGNIKYQDFELTSEYIQSDLNSNITFARGRHDTADAYIGKPKFKQGKEEFETDSLYYNLKTGRGIIYNVISQQGEGYLHSELTKRDNQGNIYVQGGKYTTCNAEHPHFYMQLSKAIVIPDDKIISGPAYLIVEDIPVKLLGLPFGFFPNSKKRGAGVIIPRYGEEQRRGFYLRGFGWYQPFGEYMDIKLLGDWYSKGSWGWQFSSDYKWRYHFNGNMTFNYNVNDFDYDTLPGKKDFKWRWSHSQDPKANPSQSFSASVNFSSSEFDLNNSYNYTDRMTNQKTSSISYTKNWAGTPFNLGISANARQNTSDSTINLNMPTGSFNASTIYPFRSKENTGKYKWYENIGFSYTSRFAGELSTRDSMLFYRTTWDNMNTGFSHTIPLVFNIKTSKIKMLTISPSLSYQGMLYNKRISKHLEGPINGQQQIITDTIKGLVYAHAINPTISLGLSPKVTGMYLNTRKNPNLIAVRHVVQPRASFSYTPDMHSINPDYYDTIYYYDKGKLQKNTYSIFEKSMYGTPSSAGQSGSLSLSLGNNLEAKLKPLNDTTGKAEPRKIVLIRNLGLATSYNPFKEEFKWSDISLNGSTQLFKNVLSLQITSRFSPYRYKMVDTTQKGDPVYKVVDEFFYSSGKGLVRFTNLSVNAGLSLKSKQGQSKEKDDAQTQEELDQANIYRDPMNPDYEFVPGYDAITGTYVDFSIPWSLSFNYNWMLNRPGLVKDQTLTHTLGFRGDFSLTKKWKIGFNSGVDLVTKEITFTNININRDLHCWEMQFSMVPFGRARNYNFTIRAKSSILRDLKFDKKQSWYDNF
ncbi:MAG: LPS-assembly protein LptD [Bacteroidales bacterium]|nr:LPS-assembly protein LptD [Bacteroidales bacterium]